MVCNNLQLRLSNGSFGLLPTSILSFSTFREIQEEDLDIQFDGADEDIAGDDEKEQE